MKANDVVLGCIVMNVWLYMNLLCTSMFTCYQMHMRWLLLSCMSSWFAIGCYDINVLAEIEQKMQIIIMRLEH